MRPLTTVPSLLFEVKSSVDPELEPGEQGVVLVRQPPQPAVLEGVHFGGLGRRAGEQRDRAVRAERDVRDRAAARRQLFDRSSAGGDPADVDRPVVLDEEGQALPVGRPADRIRNGPVERLRQDPRGAARRRHDGQLVEVVAPRTAARRRAGTRSTGRRGSRRDGRRRAPGSPSAGSAPLRAWPR